MQWDGFKRFIRRIMFNWIFNTYANSILFIILWKKTKEIATKQLLTNDRNQCGIFKINRIIVSLCQILLWIKLRSIQNMHARNINNKKLKEDRMILDNPKYPGYHALGLPPQHLLFEWRIPAKVRVWVRLFQAH